jgi:hypothetical protein
MMNIDAWLNRGITTSNSIAVEYGYWAPLAMAEVKAKLLNEQEKAMIRKQAKRMERIWSN